MKPHPLTVVALVGALAGLVLCGLSTYDFAQHIDRQVHAVHCGISSGSIAGESGCKAAMMSTYSSVLRRWVWGGLPIALPGMAVFAFLLFCAVELIVGGRQQDRRSTGFFLAAATLPAGASLVMAAIAIFAVGAVCTVCLGIYLASALCCGSAFMLWRRAGRRSAAGDPRDVEPQPRAEVDIGLADTIGLEDEAARDLERGEDARLASAGGAAGDSARGAGVPRDDEPAWVADLGAVGVRPPKLAVSHPRAETAQRGARRSPRPAVNATLRQLVVAAALGGLFVLLPTGTYLLAAPDQTRFAAGCGRLETTRARRHVLVPYEGNGHGRAAIEVLDPLCPACAGFEQQLRASGLRQRLDRKVLLFPLDAACNWMVERTVHPGACSVSEAVLCAGDRAADVISWALAEQAEILEASRHDPAAARRMVVARFPHLARCVGSPRARARLNRALRWAVANHLPVLTPQLYVDGVKVCDADLDIGLEYTLSRMLAGGVRTPEAGPKR